MIGQFGEMVLCAAGKNSAMDGGMECLYTAVKELREAGKSLRGLDWQARVGKLGGGTAAGDQLDAGVMKLLGKGYKAGLVGNGDQRTLVWHGVAPDGKLRCQGNKKGSRKKTQLPQPRRSTVHKRKLIPGGSSPLWYLSTHAKCVLGGQFPSQMNPSARQSRSPSQLGLYANTEEGAEQGSPAADAAAGSTDCCRFRAVDHETVSTENGPLA